MIDSGRSGRVYAINYRDGKVIDLHHSSDRSESSRPPTALTDAEKKAALGHEKYAGEECALIPVYDSGPNLSQIIIGKAWVSPRLNDLILKEDIVHHLSGGGARHVVRRLVILKQGVEPKAEYFATDSASVIAHGKKQAEIH
jgi:hypothetical protein